jgi:putative transposase
VLYGKLRREIGKILRELALQRESEIIEGHLCIDHIHMLIKIPPKYAVSQVIGYIKGKSAIRIARDFMSRGRNYQGYHFWARGFFVSTVGADEEVVSQYIRSQEKEDLRIDAQKRLF